MISYIPRYTLKYPGIPRNTWELNRYQIPESYINTVYISTLLPDPNPTRYQVFFPVTRPNPSLALTKLSWRWWWWQWHWLWQSGWGWCHSGQLWQWRQRLWLRLTCPICIRRREFLLSLLTEPLVIMLLTVLVNHSVINMVLTRDGHSDFLWQFRIWIYTGRRGRGNALKYQTSNQAPAHLNDVLALESTDKWCEASVHDQNGKQEGGGGGLLGSRQHKL